MNTIRAQRVENALTQKQAADFVGIPLRTYKNYETDASKVGSIKYDYILNALSRYGYVDEDHGVLTAEAIASACKAVLRDYPVPYCILFGSYARGDAGERSDVDLVIPSTVSGMKFYGIAEKLREKLKKRVDLLDAKQLANNPELLDNILREGVRIYVQE